MLDGLGDSVTWYCDNCDNIIPVGTKAYRLPNGTILCSDACVDDYAFTNDKTNRADSDILADVWNTAEEFVIPEEDEI